MTPALGEVLFAYMLYYTEKKAKKVTSESNQRKENQNKEVERIKDFSKSREKSMKKKTSHREDEQNRCQFVEKTNDIVCQGLTRVFKAINFKTQTKWKNSQKK